MLFRFICAGSSYESEAPRTLVAKRAGPFTKLYANYTRENFPP